MAYVGALQSIGLLNDDPSPAERVFADTISDDSEATIREVTDTEETPDGQTVFSSYMSEVVFSSLDVDGMSQVETWMDNRQPVKAAAALPLAFVMWQRDARINARGGYSPTEPGLQKGEYMMRLDAGDIDSHGVYVTRNALIDLAPSNGGWADTDSDNTPDGYTETSLNSTAWNSGVYEGFVDTGAGTGSLNAEIPFPLDNVEVTLSVQVDQVHDDGNQAIRIEALDENKATITNGTTDVTYSTTGRKSATLTTPTGTHFLKVYPVRVTSVTANTAKFQIQDPCLRRGANSTYVTK